ncbi:MAG: hypothetical protein ABR542_04655 [Desulfonatronovibrio sp.]
MNILYQVISISPQDLNTDDPCLLWAQQPDSDYIENIQHIGQLNPVLITTENSRKTLVTGYKRYMALKGLGRNILALEIDSADSYTKGLIYLSSNYGRPLKPGMIIAALRYFSDLKSLNNFIWKNLDITPCSKAQELWASWIKLPQLWDEILARGNISLECAPILCKMSEHDLSFIYQFFSTLSWSRNHSINFITWLQEKSIIDETDISRLRIMPQLKALLDSELSPNDKIKSIMKKLYSVRYPLMFEMSARLDSRIREAVSGTKWRFEHKDNFESQNIAISRQIKNQEDLQKAAEQLQAIADSKTLKNWPVNINE